MSDARSGFDPADSAERPTAEPADAAIEATGAAADPAAADVVDYPATGPDPAVDEADEPPAEKEWWDDPGMPWRRKPTRSDFACLAWIGFLGLFSMAMLPLRAWLLAEPERLPWLVGLMGSRSGTAALGSVVRVGTEVAFVWPILLGTFMSIKLDWVYWWAGKLWGRGMIEVWAGQSPRAARNYARVERWADKMGWVGMFVAYAPIPLPIMAVVFVLAGAQGWSWKRFMMLDFAAALTWLLAYFAFGFAVGEPAVAVLEMYGRIANYVVIALVVGIVGLTLWRGAKQSRQKA